MYVDPPEGWLLALLDGVEDPDCEALEGGEDALLEVGLLDPEGGDELLTMGFPLLSLEEGVEDALLEVGLLDPFPAPEEGGEDALLEVGLLDPVLALEEGGADEALPVGWLDPSLPVSDAAASPVELCPVEGGGEESLDGATEAGAELYGAVLDEDEGAAPEPELPVSSLGGGSAAACEKSPVVVSSATLAGVVVDCGRTLV